MVDDRSSVISRRYAIPRIKGKNESCGAMQAVGVESKKRFRIGEQSDPLALLTWLLNVLHRDQRDKKTDSELEIRETTMVPTRG